MYCMAHRGFSGKAPENTLAAFKKALELDVVNSMELDVQLSKDGIPVVIHDFTLERTTNGYGYVKDKTFQELRELDAGSWFSNEFVGEKIPSLEEVLQLCKGKCNLNIELKTARGFYDGYENIVIDLVKKYDMEEEVCLTSFDHEVIKNIKNIQTKIKTGLIIEGNPVLLIEQLVESGATILSIDFYYLTTNLVEKMTNAGIKIVTWTVNDPSMIADTINISKEIHICTNYPNRYKEVIDEL